MRNLAIQCAFQQSTDGRVAGTWFHPGTTLTGTLDPAAINRIDANASAILRFKVTGGGGFGFLDFEVENGRMETPGNRVTGSARGSSFNGDPFVLNRLDTGVARVRAQGKKGVPSGS